LLPRTADKDLEDVNKFTSAEMNHVDCKKNHYTVNSYAYYKKNL